MRQEFNQSPSALPRMLDTDELAAYLNIPVRTIEGWRTRKVGPPFIRFGKTVRYPEHRLLAWLDAQLEGGELDG